MITPLFLGMWFFFSAVYFGVLSFGFRISGDNQPDRDYNAFFVLFAQGLGALTAYALH